MEIKRAGLEDLSSIKQLSEEHEFETNRDWKQLITSQDKKLFVLKDQDSIIGFSGLIEVPWNNTLRISNIFIHPDYRRQRLGNKLIQYIIKQAKQTSFRCLIAEAPSSTSVKNFYEQLGFRKCGYHDRYYSNKGKPICVWMSLDLK